MGEALYQFLSLTEVWIAGLGLAAFLALFWVLRGAPIGQAVEYEDDEEAPRGGYRDRMIAAICIGLLLIGLGGYLVVTQGVAWSLIPFALGFGTVFTLVAINQRYRHGSPTMRRTVDLATTALNASLLAGILIVGNVIAFRYGGMPIDMTRDRGYSLASLSVSQLKTLDRPVTFTTFFGRSPMAAQQNDRVRQLLELFRAINPSHVKLDQVDPDRDLARYEQLVKSVPDLKVAQGGGVVIEYGEGESADRVVVRNTELFLMDRPSFNPDVSEFKSVFKGEDAITSALIRLRESKKPRIVFTTGHGEPAIDDLSTAGGLGLWKNRMTATGLDVQAINLLTQEIPDDAAALIVAAPKSAFKPDEIKRLRNYIDRKGPVMLLIGDEQLAGLEEVLRGFNLEVSPGIVVEQANVFQGRIDAMILPIVRQEHPILAPMNNELILAFRAMPLKEGPSQGNVAAGGVFTTPLLKSSVRSWVETSHDLRQAQRDPAETAGPLTVGMAINDRPRPGTRQLGPPRALVYSTPYLADNARLQISPANLDLMMNSVSWLRGRSDLAGIAPKEHSAWTLTANPTVRARLIMVPTVMAILMIVSFGLGTYLLRRD